MWLEEMTWLWLPIVSGIGIWMVWSTLALKTEVRALRQRLGRMEAGATARGSEEKAA
jgi:hypothetical protein